MAGQHKLIAASGKVQNMSNICSAFAKAGHKADVLFEAVMEKEFVQLKLILANTKQSEDSLYIQLQTSIGSGSGSSSNSSIEPKTGRCTCFLGYNVIFWRGNEENIEDFVIGQ